MKQWTDLIRVSEKGHPLFGKTGHLARRRVADNGAWIAMDEPLPPELRRFPDDDSRASHYLLYPEQCEKA